MIWTWFGNRALITARDAVIDAALTAHLRDHSCVLTERRSEGALRVLHAFSRWIWRHDRLQHLGGVSRVVDAQSWQGRPGYWSWVIDDASRRLESVGTEAGWSSLAAEADANGHRLIDLEIVDVDRGVSMLWNFCVQCGTRFRDRSAIDDQPCPGLPSGIVDPRGHDLAVDPDLEWVVCQRCERRGETQADVDRWPDCEPLPETSGPL
jgi:hypothetical protein